MPIRHKFVSGKAASADATEVDGVDWDADHNFPPVVVTLLAQHGAVSWTNMPAALTEWNAGTRTRTRLDLTNVSEARLTASTSTVGSANAQARVQYSTDQTTWAYLDDVAGPSASIAALGGSAGAWVTLVAGAKADVWVRLVGIDGDGAADPIVGLITLQLR